MRKLFHLLVAAAVALAFGAPAVAERNPPPSAAERHDDLASVLSLRLRSIDIQIDMLSDRGLIGRDEASELRQQGRRLAERLYRMSPREAREVELAVDRLQASLRSAAELAELNASTRRDLGRFDDGDRYQGDVGSYSERDSYRRPDPRGDPYAKWDARDCREGIC